MNKLKLNCIYTHTEQFVSVCNRITKYDFVGYVMLNFYIKYLITRYISEWTFIILLSVLTVTSRHVKVHLGLPNFLPSPNIIIMKYVICHPRGFSEIIDF